MRRDAGLELRPRRGRGLALCVFALGCAAVCFGCTDDPESIIISPQCIEFIPDDATPQGKVVTRMGSGSNCNFVQIEFVATDLAGIYSTEIQVEYSIALARYFSLEVGPLWTGDASVPCEDALAAESVYCLVTNDFPAGTIDIAISLTGDTTVNASSGGTVLGTLTLSQLTFLSGANGPLDFRFGKLVNNDTGPDGPQNIIDYADDPSTFVGGTLIIRDQ